MEESKNNSLQHSIDKVQEHGDKLLQQNMEFIKQIASLEASQKAFEGRLDRQTENIQNQIDKQQENLEHQISKVEKNLSKELHDIVGEQINALVATSTAHQDTLVRLTTIQENQQRQIDGLQEQMNEFAILRHDITDLSGRLSATEERLTSLEHSVRAQNQNQVDVDKTKIQGRWALITAIASGFIGVVSTVLAILLK